MRSIVAIAAVSIALASTQAAFSDGSFTPAQSAFNLCILRSAKTVIANTGYDFSRISAFALSECMPQYSHLRETEGKAMARKISEASFYSVKFAHEKHMRGF